MYSVIITDYKSIEETFSYIDDFPSEVSNKFVVVDNSAEASAEKFLEKNSFNYSLYEFEEKKLFLLNMNKKIIYIIDANENGGYSKGNNLGAKIAREFFSSKYYIFSNNDVKITNSAYFSIIPELFSQYNIGILGGKVISPDGNLQSPRKSKSFFSQMILQYFNILWFRCKFNKYLWDVDTNANQGKVDWISGCFMIIASSAFHQVNGFDENTFLYCEEMILSTKLLDVGYITYYYPQIEIIHEHHGTPSRLLREIAHKSKRYYYHQYVGIPEIFCNISDFIYWLCETGLSFRQKFKR
ncbi:hypothetical protein [Actinobacillus equuli]|uniref:hypothetical protein n=1 Tax=Actinobacillus equuli TaxID=718 RepID=UPI002442D70B|nr:hypothetical protein [Actinobacillus equuli]WGE57046.1 hypothetical protein NYR71_10095 [Actinobacillus equuli subsp. equuli]